MKTFKEVAQEQNIPYWLKVIMEELSSKGYALESNYRFKEISIFNSVPKSMGYDELEKHVKDLHLSIASVDHARSIKGNIVMATINYTDNSMVVNATDEAIAFNKYISSHATYYRTMGQDGNHPTEWVESNQ